MALLINYTKRELVDDDDYKINYEKHKLFIPKDSKHSQNDDFIYLEKIAGGLHEFTGNYNEFIFGLDIVRRDSQDYMVVTNDKPMTENVLIVEEEGISFVGTPLNKRQRIQLSEGTLAKEFERVGNVFLLGRGDEFGITRYALANCDSLIFYFFSKEGNK